jgi:hypothetical protein
MRFLKVILFSAIFCNAMPTNALILSDVHEFNAPLVSGKFENFLFNLADHGYDHRTDTITNIKLSFDLREIVETEEDFTNVDDMSTWEFIIFYSWIFNGRDIYADIDTGIKVYETSWTKTYECQFTPWESETCQENLDLDGIMSSTVLALNNNLWLGDVRLDAEVTRIPEPSSLLLFGLGLAALNTGRKRATKEGTAARLQHHPTFISSFT